MRVLLAGIIGAVAAAAVWMAIEHNASQEFGWIAVFVGLVTGFAVHWSAGARSAGGFARGALAAILAIAACVASRQVYAKVMTKTNMGAAVIVTSGTEVKEAETETGGTAVVVEEISEEQVRPAADMSMPGKMTIKKGSAEWDMLWLSLAGLSAYLIGKGRDVAVTATDEQPGGDSPATEAETPATGEEGSV